MTFHPGQKIVCVHDDWRWSPHAQTPFLPKKGEIYHFRGWLEPSFLQLDEAPDIGIVRIGYASWAFRPLDERSTDISVFKKLLAPLKGKERVREDA